MKKRLISAIILACMSAAMCVAAEPEISVLLNGERLQFSVAPQLVNDRVMVPMRKIFESLGAEVVWEDDTQRITAAKGELKVVMQIDNPSMQVDGAEIILDSPPLLFGGSTLVPSRAGTMTLRRYI